MAVFIKRYVDWRNQDLSLFAPNSRIEVPKFLPRKISWKLMALHHNTVHFRLRKGETVFEKACGSLWNDMLFTKGPSIDDTPDTGEKILRSCYSSAVQIAAERGNKTLQVPCISSDLSPFPAAWTLSRILPLLRTLSEQFDIDIYIEAPDVEKDLLAYIETEDLSEYLEHTYTPYIQKSGPENQIKFSIRRQKVEDDEIEFPPSFKDILPELQTALEARKDPFSTALLQYANKSGFTDAEIYNRANIDRRLFSKMKKPDYQPGKGTILALCIAMRLTMEETEDLLERAGYAISPHSKFDLIVAYFIKKGFYDVDRINQVLFSYHETLLGSR